MSSKKKRVGPVITTVPRRCRKNIELFFHSLKNKQDKLEQYRKDWGDKIKPKSDLGKLNRWRFAFCTVHTPWLYSCLQYLDVRNLYESTLEGFIEKLSYSSGGMYKIKGEGIYNLQNLWQNSPELFSLSELSSREEWQTARNRLARKLNKLGLAKTSFAIEMLQPLKAKVICIDRHMFKTFGWENVDKSASHKQYEYFENYWLDLCEEHNVEPAISRNYYWDIIQQQPSSMYWGEYLKDYDYIIHTTLN